MLLDVSATVALLQLPQPYGALSVLFAGTMPPRWTNRLRSAVDALAVDVWVKKACPCHWEGTNSESLKTMARAGRALMKRSRVAPRVRDLITEKP